MIQNFGEEDDDVYYFYSSNNFCCVGSALFDVSSNVSGPWLTMAGGVNWYPTSDGPFITRGGSYSTTANMDQFSCAGFDGEGKDSVSFRPVVIIL